MSEYVYYWGQNEEATWKLISLLPQIAVERCFPTQLEARRHCMGFRVWRREITDKGFSPPELIKK